MQLKAILFDLDGTLLPMDQDEFTKIYLKMVTEHMIAQGYEANGFFENFWASVKNMLKNDGTKTNEQAFWEKFTETYGEASISAIPYLEEFYKTQFQSIKDLCHIIPEEQAIDTIKKLKEQGFRLVIATNPLFPEIATHSRVKWAGLDIDNFELCTTYENSSFSKPQIGYYQEIISQLGLMPEECLMVGNDVDDDMTAAGLGMKVFLLTNHLVNRQNADISIFPNGDWQQLLEYIENNK
ncbi:MAG: HAD family hydrolase [Firmicutes bacterium]|nr:HAD family hydrolase [Bacillota bacterium]